MIEITNLEQQLFDERNRLESIRIQELKNQQLSLFNKYKNSKYIVTNDIVDRHSAIKFYKIKD